MVAVRANRTGIFTKSPTLGPSVSSRTAITWVRFSSWRFRSRPCLRRGPSLAAEATGSHRRPLCSGAAGCLLIPVGVALNHSLAALALFAPVAFMSFLLFPGGTRYQRFVLPAVVLVLVATIAAYTSGGFRAELMGSDSSSFATRQDIWAHTFRLIGQTFPVGTGMGSFPSVYVLGEDPTNIGLTYINHAHNDYLEILLEGGLVGAILGAAFLAWWTVRAARLWWPQPGEDLQRAATIATAALLLHSLVDYPLRTAAMASVFAMCLATMAMGSAHSREWSRFRTARHLKIA